MARRLVVLVYVECTQKPDLEVGVVVVHAVHPFLFSVYVAEETHPWCMAGLKLGFRRGASVRSELLFLKRFIDECR